MQYRYRANKILHPGCPSCASEVGPSTNKDLVLERVDFSNMKKVADCPHCGSTITVPEEMQASLDDSKLYCIICSHVIQAEDYDDEEQAPENGDEDEDEEDELDETITDDESEEEDGELFDNPAMADSENYGNEPKAENADGAAIEESATPETNTEAENIAPVPAEIPESNENTENKEGSDSLNASLLPLFSDKEAAVEVVPNEDSTNGIYLLIRHLLQLRKFLVLAKLFSSYLSLRNSVRLLELPLATV